jgi:hypothetical protein
MNTPSFNKYIRNNPKWSSSMIFHIGKGVSNAPIMEIKENKPFDTGVAVNQNDAVRVLSKEFRKLGKNTYALVKTTSGNVIQGHLNISHIQNPLSSEIMQTKGVSIRSLDAALRNAKAPVDIIIDKFTARGITGLRDVDMSFTADYMLVDAKGSPVFWFSIPPQGIAPFANQNKSITKSSGAFVYNHPEVQSFLKSVVDYIEGDPVDEKEINEAINLAQEIIHNSDNTDDRRIFQDEFMSRGWQKASNQIRNMSTMQYRDFIKNPKLDKGDISAATGHLSVPVWRSIDDAKLKKLYVYGKDVEFRPSKYGPNNVQLIGMGNITIQPIDSMEATYEMSFSEQSSSNGNVDDIHADHDPVFLAVSASGAMFEVDGKMHYGAKISTESNSTAKNTVGSVKI